MHGNNKTKKWYMLMAVIPIREEAVLQYSRDASLSAGTGVFSNKPGKEYRMQGTYSSDVCGPPGTVLLAAGQRRSSLCTAANIPPSGDR